MLISDLMENLRKKPKKNDHPEKLFFKKQGFKVYLFSGAQF
jgi:hypothetical protein